jgi:hypothetical protein
MHLTDFIINRLVKLLLEIKLVYRAFIVFVMLDIGEILGSRHLPLKFYPADCHSLSHAPSRT